MILWTYTEPPSFKKNPNVVYATNILKDFKNASPTILGQDRLGLFKYTLFSENVYNENLTYCLQKVKFINFS